MNTLFAILALVCAVFGVVCGYNYYKTKESDYLAIAVAMLLTVLGVIYGLLF